MPSNLIGITEGADPTINLNWMPWVYDDKPAILITKRPDLLLPMLTGKENVIIHCTITGWGGTKVEPNILNWSTEIEYYHRLCTLFGTERVVLRIDPILPDYNLALLQAIREHTEGRLRISFLDAYPHVRTRFSNAGVILEQSSFHQPLELRRFIWEELGEPEVCGEPDMPSTPCVSANDCLILGVEPSLTEKQQRLVCHCLDSKRELCNKHGCAYHCLYCYWRNT